MSVLVATAYMDEAQRFDWLVAMDDGRVLDTGTPAELLERTATEDLEGLVVLVASSLALRFVVEGWLDVPIQGSIPLFAGGVALHLFATTSMGIFFGTVARSMPQLGLLIILTLMPLQILSGGMTPRESMPEVVQNVMLAAPTTHFVELAQAILFRGAGMSIVWPQLLALVVIGGVFFVGALGRLRRSLR